MTPLAPIHKHRNLLGRVAPRRRYGPRSAAPVRARDRDRSRRPARPGRAAATVLVVGLVLLGAAAAEAQTPPAVSSVEITSVPGLLNTYGIGDAVKATVTFDAAVDIDGTPQLELDFAGAAKAAACTAGTNPTTMVCSYTVAAGDVAAGGVAIGANKLTGGTITATGSTTVTADLDHVAVAIDANHKVDGIRPTLVTTGSEAPKTSTDGTQVILTFSETISSVDQTKITIQANSVTAATNAASVTGTKVELTLTTALTTTATTITVALAADAVEDNAENGILALAATAVTNAVVSPAVVSPDVSSVALTSSPGVDNTYGIGDAVKATVTFSAAVDITAAPQLELDFAGTAKAAACATDTNTTTMVCSYTVVVGDVAAGGIAIAANTLTGGTIYATGSTTITADLDHDAVDIDAGHTVDGIRPTLVTTGTDAPTTSTDGTKVILTFSETLLSTVDQTKITIQANSVTAATSAASVAGTKVELTLTTALTTTATTITVALAADAVEDNAENGNLAVTATPVTNAITDDPVVSSVALTSIPNNNTYGIGDAVEATVTFSAAVDITGTPQLELDFAGAAKAAACTAGTNPTTMVCSYTVAAGDVAAGGVAIGANKLTGGTITATGSTTVTADLDHVAVAIDANHKVDGIRPTLVTTGSEAPTTSTDGTKVILTFSEAISAVEQTKIIIGLGGSNVASTSAANVVADNTTTVELTLTTALTATATNLTVALAADAVEDNAENGNLAVTATAVTNASNTAPTFSSAIVTRNVAENSPAGTDVGEPIPAATDANGDTLTYSMEGQDAALFDFVASTRQIQTTTGVTYDYEAPKNSYAVTVRASDATDSDTIAVRITVTDVDEASNTAPTFSSAIVTRNVAENSPAGTDVGEPIPAATDANGDTLTYSMEGQDAALFDFVASTRQIQTTTGVTYDYEAPKNSYAVTVRASDATDSDTIVVTITVTEVNEPPARPAAPSVSSVAGSTTSLSVMWTAPANTGLAIDTYDLRYRQGTNGSWTNGPQNVNGLSATITGLGAGSYQVQVLATNADGDSPWSPPGSGQTNTADNAPPAFSSATASRSVAENSAAGTNVGAALTATDADSGDTLAYTLEGTDAVSFDIVSTSGQIQTTSGVTYDYETQSSYAVIVKADDGNGGSDTVMVTITVTDVDESPSPGPGPEPVPALPLLGHLLLALGLTAAGARVIRRRARVPPAA